MKHVWEQPPAHFKYDPEKMALRKTIQLLRADLAEERERSAEFVNLAVRQAQASDAMKLDLIVKGLIKLPDERGNA